MLYLYLVFAENLPHLVSVWQTKRRWFVVEAACTGCCHTSQLCPDYRREAARKTKKIFFFLGKGDL